MPRRAVITGWGRCVPPLTLSNADLERLVDTDDEWIVQRTGIRNRRLSHVEATDLAELAARRALACAGMEASDLDLIVVATPPSRSAQGSCWRAASTPPKASYAPSSPPQPPELATGPSAS